METLILALLFMLALIFAVWACGGGGDRRARLQEIEGDSKKREASQAQILHTTKLASLGQMVAGVAHEINTPLGFVKSNVEVVGDLLGEYEQAVTNVMTGIDFMLNADVATAKHAKALVAKARDQLVQATSLNEARELLTDAVEGLKQMNSLISNLKGFARVDRDGMDTISINDSIKSTLMIANHQLRDRIVVETNLGQLPNIKCMPSQINQVFLNLIINAAQAMGEKGLLRITSMATPTGIEVSIEDNGSGIPEEVLPRIFDPFFTTKEVGDGTGLGLSIVHKIIAGHGGSIRVKSFVGKGTTFFVELPIENKAKTARIGA